MTNQIFKSIIAFIFVFTIIDVGLSASLSIRLKPLGHSFDQVIKNAEYVTTDNDRRRFHELMYYLPVQIPAKAPIGEIIVAVGMFFEGAEYVSGTLDQNKDEKLVINLYGMDCVTFVEYVLAAAMVYKAQNTTFDDFASMVKQLRYRDGNLKGYASRLHYFTEWLQDNSRKGILVSVSHEFGSGVFSSEINFMSSNAHLYEHLNDLQTLRIIIEYEQAVSSNEFRYIPRNEIIDNEQYIQDGDVIAYVTAIEGLDVSHTGFAVFKDGRLHLMHASSRSGMVEVTSLPLHEYLGGNNMVRGIFVSRVIK